MKTWMDTRAYANSRWSPPYVIPEPAAGGRWQTTVTFSEPGTYVVRAVASDGSLFTYDNLTVTVTPCEEFHGGRPDVPPAPDRGRVKSPKDHDGLIMCP
jgi:hypothetical protein